MDQRGAGRFEDFVLSYGERAYQFAYRLSGNADEAKDVVQEAFYHALRGWTGFDDTQPMERWFFAILRHAFLDGRKNYWRRNRVPLEPSDGDGGGADLPADGEEEALEILERRERSALIRRALYSLAYEQRAALALCDMQGLSYAEAARVLGAPLGTVRSRLNRARALLRAKLAAIPELLQ